MRRAGVIAGLVWATHAVGQNLIVNGSFEEGNFPGGSIAMIPANATAITGWGVGSEGGIRWYPSWTVSAIEGQRCIELNEQSASSISQSVATAVGSSYRLRFWFAGDPYGITPVRTMRVFAGAAQQDFAFNVLGYTFLNMGWREEIIDFTATAPTTLIRFQSTSSSDAGPFIDHVSLEPTTPVCVADVDDGTGTGTRDGGVTVDDLLYYLFMFEEGATPADVDDGSGTGTPDGGVTIDDLLYFLLRFELGC